jgi:hypothetical protein
MQCPLETQYHFKYSRQALKKVTEGVGFISLEACYFDPGIPGLFKVTT